MQAIVPAQQEAIMPSYDLIRHTLETMRPKFGPLNFDADKYELRSLLAKAQADPHSITSSEAETITSLVADYS